VNAITTIKDDAFRSFFVQRIIVYHNALHAHSPQNILEWDGSSKLGEATSKLVEEDFDQIDITRSVIRVDDAVPGPISPAKSAPLLPPQAPPEPADDSAEEAAPDPPPETAGRRSKRRAPDQPAGSTGVNLNVRIIPVWEQAMSSKA
jgi:hypothetical protein